MSSISARPEGAEDKSSRAWHEWLAVGEGITALLAICAIIISFVALSNSSSSPAASSAGVASGVSAGNGAAAGGASAGAAGATAASTGEPQSVTMTFKADDQHAKKGPDGQWHDAALPAIYSVQSGAVITLTLVNDDSSPHSFTSPTLGVDQVVPGGSPNKPGQATVKFTAPTKAGQYEWWCKFPCDPWAMTHNGYMRGYLTVKA